MEKTLFYAPVDPEHVSRERRKARELRQTQWWRAQIGPGICYHCGEKFGKDELTMDHVIPVSRGGKTTKSNVVVSCKVCNSEKRNFTQVERVMARLCEESH